MRGKYPKIHSRCCLPLAWCIRGCTLHWSLARVARAPRRSVLIAGDFFVRVPKRALKQLVYSSIRVLGQRNDVPELMRQSHACFEPGRGLWSGLHGSHGKRIVFDECQMPVLNSACMEECTCECRRRRASPDTAHHVSPRRSRALAGTPHGGYLQIGRLDSTWKASGRALVKIYRGLVDTRQGGTRVNGLGAKSGAIRGMSCWPCRSSKRLR